MTGAVTPSSFAYSSMLNVWTWASESRSSLIIRAASSYCGIGPTGRIATKLRPSSRAARIRPTRSSANAGRTPPASSTTEIRKSGLACSVSSAREIRRTRSHSPASRKSMKRARPYSKSSVDCHCRSFHQGRRRRVVPRSQVRQGVKPSAYWTPHCRPRKRVTARICSTMSMPSWSRSHVSWLCVRLEHRDLRLDRRRHVDVLGGLEAEAHHGVHEVDRRDGLVVADVPVSSSGSVAWKLQSKTSFEISSWSAM